jgi:flavin reductase (DIM6/NTAB) family NADH-FMN oxidoreductase RutF
MVKKAGIFGVTILNDQQQELSERFAGRRPGFEGDRFAGLEMQQLVSEVAFPRQGLAFFDCRVREVHPYESTTLFIAEVVAVKLGEPGQPLAYFNRTYHWLQE